MKYICLGYIQPRKFESMSENEVHAMLDECFDYDDELRANGHFAAGEGLQPPDTATTLYWKNGKSRCDRRSLRRDQGTTRRNPGT